MPELPNPEIDEQFFPFFVDFGLVELAGYLAKVARFEEWCKLQDNDPED